MSNGETDWIELNFKFIEKTWEPVEAVEHADLRLTTHQIAMKVFELYDPPKGTIQMIQERLLELGFKRTFISYPVIEEDILSNKDNSWNVCWLLKNKYD